MRYPPASLSDELIVYVMLLVLVLYLSPGKWTLDDKKISVFSCKIGIYTMYLINVVVKIKKTYVHKHAFYQVHHVFSIKPSGYVIL